MPKPQRKESAPPITPDGLFSMLVSRLEIYKDPQQEQYGTEVVETPYQNDGGDYLYEGPDGAGQGYYAEGSEPDGWVKKTRPQPQPLFRPTRGELSGIQIFEHKDGKKINLNEEGYKPFAQAGKQDLFDMAAANADLAQKHEAFVAAAYAYMIALYDHINA